jgi:transmembrane sensor
MADFNTDIDELLAKSFAGELQPEEAEVLERWLSEDAANQAYAGAMQRIWQAGGELPATQPRPSFDTEKALKKVKKRIHGSRKDGDGWTTLRNRFFLTAAAALALLAVAWYFLGPAKSSETLIAAETPLQDTLSDGTLVALNRASGLSLQSDYNRGERRLRLQGEAFFKVQHDSSRTFTVEVQNLEISVLGTAFNVDNLTDTALVTVTVAEGRVRLQAPAQTAIVQAGESAVYRKADGSIRTSASQDSNYLSYQNRQFVFEGTPLRSVIHRLEAVYGVPVAVENPGQLDCLLTARFSSLDLERILDIIADSFSFELEKNSAGYLLKGAACTPE